MDGFNRKNLLEIRSKLYLYRIVILVFLYTKTSSMRKLLFSFSLMAFALFLLPSEVQAQNYQTAVGARLGYPLSASLKHFITDNHALEGYVGFRGFSTYSWVAVGASYQIHNEIDAVDGLAWYYGAGAAVSFWSYDSIFVGDNSAGTVFGIQGYLGLDYTFANAPVNVSADWVPTFWLSGFSSGFGGGFGALAVRYIISD